MGLWKEGRGIADIGRWGRSTAVGPCQRDERLGLVKVSCDGNLRFWAW